MKIFGVDISPLDREECVMAPHGGPTSLSIRAAGEIPIQMSVCPNVSLIKNTVPLILVKSGTVPHPRIQSTLHMSSSLFTVCYHFNSEFMYCLQDDYTVFVYVLSDFYRFYSNT